MVKLFPGPFGLFQPKYNAVAILIDQKPLGTNFLGAASGITDLVPRSLSLRHNKKINHGTRLQKNPIRNVNGISEIQLLICYQCCVLIG